MDQTPSLQGKQDLRDYLAPIWRHKWIVIALALVVTAGTYVYYNHKPRTYAASTDVYLKTTGADTLITGSTQTGSDRDLANQARILQSHAVAERVAKQLHFKGDPDSLLGNLTVTPSPDADFVTIRVVSSSPTGAAQLANTFASAFRDQALASRRQDAQTALDAARKTLSQIPATTATRDERRGLASQVNQLEILASLPSGDAVQLDSAVPSAVPVAPQPKRSAIFAFALSLMFGIIAAYGIDRIDRRIRGIDEVTPIYDAPVIATIPRGGERPPATPPAAIPTSLREPFRTLRTSLEMASADSAIKTLLVTSAVPREGKSTIIRNLAMAYRESGKRVVVVEADLRRPTLARGLFTPEEPGLTDVLQHKVTLSEATHDVPWGPIDLDSLRDALPAATPVNGSGTNGGGRRNGTTAIDGPALALLPCGTRAGDPPTLLGTDAFKLLLRELRERYDVVLIDSPPLLSVSDALPVLAEVDGTLLVSRVGTTTEENAKQVAELIARVSRTRLLGVVANDVPAAARSALYGGSYYARAV
jgi:succinoglycan biosynthesis transport protein ExoP